MLLLTSVPVRADRFDDQINALNQQIAGQQSEVNALKAQSDTLKNKLGSINAQIASVRTQIVLAQLRYNKVTADLEAAKLELVHKKAILAENVRLIYQEGKLSPLEVLASSGSFSDFIDRQQYMQTLKDKVQTSIADVNALKKKLETEQRQQADLMTQQRSLQYALGQQQAEANNLLAQTQNQESNYQGMIANNKKQISSLQRQQAAEIAARSYGSTYGGSGGYPWANAPKDGGADPWGFYWRECTSYAAWRRAAMGRPIPAWGRMGQANAKDWPGWARGSGMRVDSTPEVGAIGVFSGGQYGHVMIVESISSDSVLVSQYNADFSGRYSQSHWSISNLVFIH